MSRYTLHYEIEDDIDSTNKSISGETVKKRRDDNYVLHSFHDKSRSIVFDIDEMKGQILLSDGQVKDINVIGYQEWYLTSEIKMCVVERQGNKSFLQDDIYNIKFLGCVSFDYNNIDEKGINMTINDKDLNLTFNEQNDIRIKYPSYFDVSINSDKSKNDLELPGQLVNIAFPDHINNFRIDGSDFSHTIYSQIG